MADHLLLSSLFNQAVAAIAAQEYRAAHELCNAMLEQHAKDVNARKLLVKIALDTGREDDAIELLTKLVKTHPESADFRVNLGDAYQSIGRYQPAHRQYEKARSLEPGLAGALAGQALVYELQDRYDRARKLLAPVATRDDPPAAVVAAYLRVLVHDGDLDEAVKLGRAAVAREHAADKGLRDAWFALAKALERRGDALEAFDAAASAHAIDAPEFDIERHRSRVDRLIAVFSKEALAARPQAEHSSDVPVLIVGMPRTGSTLVERILAAHPLVHGAGESSALYRLILNLSAELDTVEAYPDCAEALDAASAQRLGRRYVDELTRRAPRAVRVIDKNLGNYFHLGLVQSLLPRARVIHVRRDPLDTCTSCWMEPILASSVPFANDLAHLGFYYRQYERLMTHWREALTIDVLELRYEDLVTDQRAVTEQLLSFCDLPFDERCLKFHELKRYDRTVSFDQVRRPMYRSSVGRAERFGSRLDALRAALAGEGTGR